MKIVLNKILIFVLVLALTHQMALKRRKIKRTNLLSKEFKRALSASFRNIHLTFFKVLGSGSFGVILSVKERNDIVVKAIEIKDRDSDITMLAEREIGVMNYLKGLKFSLPLCYDIKINTEKAYGFALVLPRAKTDLWKYAQELHDKHPKNQFFFLKILKKLINTQEEQRNAIEQHFMIKLEILIQIALSVEELHKKQIIHKDIKPDNFLLIGEEGDQPGKVLLTDFGFASKSEEHYSLVEGTRGYVPCDKDEHSAEDEFKVSTKTDMYAVGVTFLNLIDDEFYICSKEHRCDFPGFRRKLIVINSNFAHYFQEFKKYLDSKERTISPLQEKVEDIIFQELLVEYENRIESHELVKKLEEIDPELFEKVVKTYGKRPIRCPKNIIPNLGNELIKLNRAHTIKPKKLREDLSEGMDEEFKDYNDDIDERM